MYSTNSWRDSARRRDRKWVFGRVAFASAVVVFEALLIIAAALATGMAYHRWFYGHVGDIGTYAIIGALTALLYSVPIVGREEYNLQDFLDGKRAPARTFVKWNYAILFLAVIGMMTKTTGDYSRAWLIAFYVLGLLVVIALDTIVARLLTAAMAGGRVKSRRVMLVGASSDIEGMTKAIQFPKGGFRVVATAVLPETTSNVAEALSGAIDHARALGVEDVVILTDWSRGELIEDVVDAFTVLPVAIHLGASGMVGRFSDARISHFGQASALSLTAPPLGLLQSAAKRTIDLVLASLAVLLLAPVFAGIAWLITRDSKGPVFFRQRRRGYNLVEFRIWKFRTMTTLDDGDVVRQASAGDDRVTRIGAVLRRYNLDELPQLLNVITGEMSLVGPRPHAVAHDRLFETRIAKYRRRLNVRPGITGWDQINGLRGPTETEDAMRRRVEHDLYYIDNWSIALDFYILAATVLSRKAFKNAL
jgi:Undecaprenyl-phosphate glucose phosphotransferase